MTTIHPHGLAKAIDNHETFELLDVRSRDEFNRMHIRGARSVPLRMLRPAQLLRARALSNPAPLFLISDRRARASLAAGVLEAGGCLRPVVVEGGMLLWQAQGLPVIRPLRRHIVRLATRVGDVMPVMLRLRSAGCEAMRAIRQVLSGHRENNAWWCRCEFHVREAYRG